MVSNGNKSKTYDVVIDAGHGYKYYELAKEKGKDGKEVTVRKINQDLGADHGRFTESYFSRNIEEHIKHFAAPYEQYGVKFHYTSDAHDGKVFANYKESVRVRSNFTHAAGAEEFISMHFDARGEQGYKGIATFYKDDADKKLAQEVLKDLLNGHKTAVDQHARQENFGVLRNNGAVPSTLIEFGNFNEDILRSDVWRENMARAIVLSSVERAKEAGMPIPQEKIDAMRAECETKFTANLGKIEDPGQLLASKTEAKPKAGQVKAATPQVPDEPRLTDKQKLEVAQKTFPDLKNLEVVKGGHIYANGDRSTTVATFMSDSKLFINEKFRDKYSDGEISLVVDDKILADVRAGKPTESKVAESRGAKKITDEELQKIAEKAFPQKEGLYVDKGNIYSKDSKGLAIASPTSEGNKLFIRAEFRNELSGGKETIEIDKFREERVAGKAKPQEMEKGKKLSALDQAIGQLQSAGLAMTESANKPMMSAKSPSSGQGISPV